MSFFQLSDADFELISEPVVMQEDSTQQCARRKLLSLIILMENVLHLCVYFPCILFCKCWSFGYQKFFHQSSGCACNHGWCHRKLQ